eukprot:CAMPEP_0182424932 /NCGR_PEP_ID=MMETSP1167-20130531/11230_1 /TAXON_ID=2988 /ORGANISM="Mallomonas Sp, Strain CCMP3275" /LENGTH=170 /DNA_ID=CAMNT_0024605143 /DNA_START=125 /DNA_END=637 /DNA_ORIENTATION=-
MADKSKAIPFLPQPPNLVGIPGERGFDPLGFTNWIPVTYLQEAELKHCRIAMLAVVGWIVPSFFTLPGEMHQVSSIAAHDAAVGFGGMQQILLWTSLFEILSVVAIKEMLEGSGRAPGYFGFDPLGFAKTPEKMTELQAKEIENGRLAMLAFSGICTQAVLFGSDFPYLS